MTTETQQNKETQLTEAQPRVERVVSWRGVGEGIAFFGMCVAAAWIETTGGQAVGLWAFLVAWAFFTDWK